VGDVVEELSASERKVQRALVAAGVQAHVVRLPQSARTAAEAAAALGCRVAQIAKTLVFRRVTDSAAVLIVVSGANRVEEKLIARQLGADVVKADAAFVRHATGFAIGGVAPLGHDTTLETLMDEDLLQLQEVWAAAGSPHAVFAISPAQLAASTHARVVRVTRQHV
jgi:prolyl-tRNA editing enzyme YbaK/EbsC (Cys-tRNA(Pro) deacylase)